MVGVASVTLSASPVFAVCHHTVTGSSQPVTEAVSHTGSIQTTCTSDDATAGTLCYYKSTISRIKPLALQWQVGQAIACGIGLVL